MSNLRFQYFCFLLICVILCCPRNSLGDTCLRPKHVALYVFGDSGHDAGNMNYINGSLSAFRANHWPYGQTFFKFPSGRFSDGRLVPDFIAEYGKLPLIKPYLHPGYRFYTDGANFASAGAGALSETRQGSVLDLKTQVIYYKKVHMLLREELGDEAAQSLVSRSVHLISTGANDYAVYITNSTVLWSNSHQDYVSMVIGNISSAIQDIYNMGGRKFGIRNVGPLGCSPSMRVLKGGAAGDCVEEATKIVKLHNNQLYKMLIKLGNELQGFKYELTDYFTFLTELMNNPFKYGFKEGNVACCGSGPYRGIPNCGLKIEGIEDHKLCANVNDYVFFDYSHPTEKVNQKLSKLMWDGKGSGPYNLKALFEL
ncbi:GDSL esterase/lipase 1-like [Neltuma alba]|uniref:GDSL esterase/lipase 1-like n=1 Tax=Neltuma alba TaxID=207710 RepID=UPI0010A5436F|nr:GDSL esterase/lipase 1-like [Prosopis alba]XP_028783584.1 GDSL esterase/lipase 1-like [Prosopis alba]